MVPHGVNPLPFPTSASPDSALHTERTACKQDYEHTDYGAMCTGGVEKNVIEVSFYNRKWSALAVYTSRQYSSHPTKGAQSPCSTPSAVI